MNHDKLAQAEIFHDLTPEEVKDLCSHGDEITFEVGQSVFDRGQPAQEVLILQDGVVELFLPVPIMGAVHEVGLQQRRSGEFVGWSALVAPYCFTMSARCLSRCRCTRLRKEALLGYFDAHPHVGFIVMRNVAGLVGRRLYSLQDTWIDDTRASAAKRFG